MQIKPVNSMILVERQDKAANKRIGGFIASLPSNNLGTVKFTSNPTDYPVGCQVYFGGNTEQIVVDGSEVLAMKDSNIIAVVGE